VNSSMSFNKPVILEMSFERGKHVDTSYNAQSPEKDYNDNSNPAGSKSKKGKAKDLQRGDIKKK